MHFKPPIKIVSLDNSYLQKATLGTLLRTKMQIPTNPALFVYYPSLSQQGIQYLNIKNTLYKFSRRKKKKNLKT